jgi:hypothetical protein
VGRMWSVGWPLVAVGVVLAGAVSLCCRRGAYERCGCVGFLGRWSAGRAIVVVQRAGGLLAWGFLRSNGRFDVRSGVVSCPRPVARAATRCGVGDALASGFVSVGSLTAALRAAAGWRCARVAARWCGRRAVRSCSASRSLACRRVSGALMSGVVPVGLN